MHPWMALTLFPQHHMKFFGVIYLLWPLNSFQSHYFPRQTIPSCRLNLYSLFLNLLSGIWWERMKCVVIEGYPFAKKSSSRNFSFFFFFPPMLSLPISSASLSEVILYSLPCSWWKCFQSLLLKAFSDPRQYKQGEVGTTGWEWALFQSYARYLLTNVSKHTL